MWPFTFKGSGGHTLGHVISISYIPIKSIIEGQDGPLILKYLTGIDPVTGCFKIVKYNDKQAATIKNNQRNHSYVDTQGLQ